MQLGNAAQLHFLAQLHAQETCRRVEHLDALLDVFGALLAHDGDEHLGMADVTADIHCSDGDQAHTRVFHFAADQLRQFALHLVANALGTAIFFCHVYYL
ncbi:hypothetical protein D9M71_651610 [compost metagenome]